ncbi:hypothetical protein GCM10010357_67360 [Streptomyces luteireticuli]|uniref:Uncharacterized protein n=1 Tax=Streptomyces luteireticuli TaxID=173858 RepID=A0ABN0Z7J8_9ACTN
MRSGPSGAEAVAVRGPGPAAWAVSAVTRGPQFVLLVRRERNRSGISRTSSTTLPSPEMEGKHDKSQGPRHAARARGTKG